MTSTVLPVCTSSATSGSFAAARCSGNDRVAGTQTVPSTGAPGSHFWIQAPLIQLAWKSSDRITTTKSSSSSSSKSSATAAALTIPSSDSSTTASATAASSGTPAFVTDNTPPGLTMAAAIGIGVAAALVALAITAVIMYILSKRRRRKDERAATPSTTSAPDPLKFHAIKYGPSVEDQRADHRNEPGANGSTLDMSQESSPQAPHVQEPRPSAVADARAPSEDVLYRRLYEEVRGGEASG